MKTILLIVLALVLYDASVYFCDGTSVNIAWNASDTATSYRIWSKKLETGELSPKATVTGTSYTFPKTKTGHLEILVEACNSNGCSDSSSSIDPTKAVVGTTSRGWMIFFRPSPVIIR